LKYRINYIVFLLFLSFSYLPLLGQVQKTEQFELSDFLGERIFKSATQSDDLIIYFNTSKGILSYNGHNFKKIGFEINNTAINEIQYFQNALFIASQNSLLQYFPDNDSTSSLSDIKVKQFKKFNNQLWLITESELFVWENKRLKSVHKAEKDEVFQCFEVNNTFTLLGHNNGLTLLEKGKEIKKFGSYLNPKKIKTNDSTTHILSENAVFELKNEKITRTFKNETSINHFYMDDFGKTWFVDNQNVLRLNDLMKTKVLFFGDEKKPIYGKKLFPDKENNLWVLGDNSLIKITQNNPFSKLFEEKSLGVYLGQNDNLIIKPDELINISTISKNTRIKVPKSLQPVNENYAIKTESGWLVTLNQSIFTWNKNEPQLTLIKNNSSYLPIKRIQENQYLAKSKSGDLFLTNESFEPIEKLDQFRSIIKTTFDDQKNYLYTKNNAIITLDSLGKEENKVTIADSINIENVIPATNGYWYYTAKNIYKINDKGSINKASFDFDIDLNDEIILNIFDDKEENLWVSFKDDLLRMPISEKNGNITLQKPISYNKADFIFSSYFKNAVKDASGLIWFINQKGISIYNPLKEIPNLVAPSIKIENAFSYKLDDFNNPSDTLYLTNNNEKINSNSIIVIQPQVINHLNTHKSSIGYKNLSINQSERKIGINQKIILTDLSDGLNTINLKAYNSNGIESKNEANINVYVTPPIWKRNWFYLTTALSLLFLSFIGYRTVISIKNNRARELEDELHKGLEDLEKKSHLQVLKAERLKQLNELITSQKSELEKKNKQIESQKYELSLTNQQIKKQKDLLEETSSKLTSSINYAKRIQNALMSTEIEIKKAFTESFVYFLPRDVVSGDFFWFNKATNDKGEELLILAAVDCTGHGVPGAIVSVVGMNLLNNITKLKQIYDPGKILTEMNRDIISDLRQDETQVNDGMDMTIVTYNTVTKQLYFAGAKNPLMYVEDNELIRIKGDKHAIGGQQRGEERNFNSHQLDLTDGKTRTFYLFSDGYQDQFGGEKGFKYLVGNFKKLLLSIHDKKVLDQKTILHEEIEDWKDGYSQTDDILVIGFKL